MLVMGLEERFYRPSLFSAAPSLAICNEGFMGSGGCCVWLSAV